MALFRRKQVDTTSLPPEVQDYYQAERRGRSWAAWVLALITLIVTVLLVLGLFFGGRFIYRKVRGTDKPAPVAVQTDNDDQEAQNPTPSTPANPPTVQAPQGSTPSQLPSDGTTSPTTTAPNGTGTTPTQTTTPTPDGNLPNSGPGDTLAIFLAVSVLAYVAHRRFLAKS